MHNGGAGPGGEPHLRRGQAVRANVDGKRGAGRATRHRDPPAVQVLHETATCHVAYLLLSQLNKLSSASGRNWCFKGNFSQ